MSKEKTSNRPYLTQTVADRNEAKHFESQAIWVHQLDSDFASSAS